MARTPRPDIGGVDKLRQSLADHFRDSPLAAIGQQLSAQLDQLDALHGWCGIDDNVRQDFLRRCSSVLSLIPAADRISQRFWFDIAMIGAAFDGHGNSAPLLPSSILPRAATEWAYFGVHLPNLDPTRMPRIDFVTFPGEDDPDSINLLTYPWLFHELGHLLLVLQGQEFRSTVGALVDDLNKETQRNRLGKAAAVQERSRKLQERISQAWRPSPGHTDWSHEIATDVIALWSCGPAFIAAYNDSVEGQLGHVIDDVHPPYEVRTAAVIEAATRLGWSGYTAPLTARLEHWKQDTSGARDESFLALSNERLSLGVLAAALDACARMCLPRCDAAKLVLAQEYLSPGVLPVFGRPLVIASWLKYEQVQGSANLYHEWEMATVESLLQQVTPQAQ